MQQPFIHRFGRCALGGLAGLRRRLPLAAASAAALVMAAALSACGTPPARTAVFDFGPGATQPVMANRKAPLPPLLLSDVEASSALDGTAVLYRLAYADAQQLRPYAQARWSMPPAQLLRQRLREQLGLRRSVFTPGDAVAPGTLALRLELEEFSQLFSAAQTSSGLLRVRATVARTGSPAKTLAQTSFVLQRAAASADAAGGVQALAQASDALVQQLEAWLQQVAAAEPAP
ncbi:MAG: membrane integrity-associated transporter subunit PqiC [Rhodoferax sp.]|nr:membrane integrity-associated transporter subunit PqiC [Rhodoferax sp.]